jgi:hypothetical protein
MLVFPLYNIYLTIMSFLTPLISATFPSSRPGPHKHIGYAFLSTPALAPWSLKSPTFSSNGRPALNLSNIGYAVYYPSVPPKRGWLGGGEGTVDWVSDPKREVVRGYERFLGQRAYWILGKLISTSAGAGIADVSSKSYEALRVAHEGELIGLKRASPS